MIPLPDKSLADNAGWNSQFRFAVHAGSDDLSVILAANLAFPVAVASTDPASLVLLEV
jgi:hypothetical protein